MRTLSLFNLLLVLLVHSASAISEARYSFAATAGKLPKDVVPKHYLLRIEPAADNERFAGRAEIDIEVAKAVASITLNASGLRFERAVLTWKSQSKILKPAFDAALETVTLTPETGPIATGAYRLLIDYTGEIGRHSQGFYRIDYKASEGGRLSDKVMLATQMEPVHARRLFPGWDEPAFRATFELSAVVDSGLTAVSNMPLVSETPHAKNRKEVKFQRSVPMATYLVALFIGEMDKVEDSVDGVRLGIYTAKGKTGRARFAMDMTKEIVRWYNEYFDFRYALPKLDQIALPGGIGGAMENWGAIAYNEGRLLTDGDGASLRQQQGIYGIIAHEIAHQWFGNLVTMAWWDNLWLNEGFAQWMQTRIAERFHPEWGTRLRAGLWRQWAMTEDARKTTHPIQTPVENDARAMDVFDSITYSKGEAFIGMLEGYLGEDAFRDGLRRYMKAHAFSNTTTADLWSHLSAASGRDVAALAAAWTEQPGFPLVSVAQRCEGGSAVVTLSQGRFTLNDPGALKLLWKVPVTLADVRGKRQTVLLDGSPRQVQAGPCGAVLANAGNVGYFRVEYDARTFGELAQSLEKLPAAERFRLLADTFALMQAGRADAGRYLSLVDRLGEESDATVWDHVVSSLRFLRDLIDAPADRAAFDRRVASLLARPFARIGWDARPGESADLAPLRRSLIDALGRAGNETVVREARARYAQRESRPIDVAIRPAVLNVVGRYADPATFDALLQEMRNATDIELKWQLQGALRSVADPGLLGRWMDFVLEGDLPQSEVAFNLQRSGPDSGHYALGWDYVRANLSAIYAKASPRGRINVLPEAASPFADEKIADELLALTRAKLDPGAYYQAEKMADWIRVKALVKAREGAAVARWADAKSD